MEENNNYASKQELYSKLSYWYPAQKILHLIRQGGKTQHKKKAISEYLVKIHCVVIHVSLMIQGLCFLVYWLCKTAKRAWLFLHFFSLLFFWEFSFPPEVAKLISWSQRNFTSSVRILCNFNI